jgi:molybdate transport system regulatory protein
MNPPKKTIITGTLSLQSEGFGQFSEQQILLLQAINLTGSITKAAKNMGISYKTAWDRIETMNNLSITPLVKRSAGGAKGGGTALTEKAEQIIAEFLQIQQEHSKLLQRIGGELDSNKTINPNSSKGVLQSSARNQLRGQIADIVAGKIDSEISINLGNSIEIVATITNTSRADMDLDVGKFIIALIKSSWIILSKNLGLKTSARNNLEGEIVRLIKGDVNTEVIIDIGNGKTLCTLFIALVIKNIDLPHRVRY